MAFKEVTQNRTYRAWGDWEPGDTLTGTYLASGTKEGGPYGPQKWYDVEVISSNFIAKKGKIYRLNGNGSLNSKMTEVEVGETLQFVFNGMDTMTKGKFKGKDFYDITVLREDENEIEDQENYDL